MKGICFLSEDRRGNGEEKAEEDEEETHVDALSRILALFYRFAVFTRENIGSITW